MPSAYTLVPQAVGQQRPQIIQATVSATQPLPATFSDPLFVVEPSRPDSFVVVPTWTAGSLPSAGAPVTVLKDNSGNLVGIVGGQHAPPRSAEIIVPPPTGIAAIDTPAIQACVNLGILGTATDSRTAPMTNAVAQHPVKLSPGQYATNAPIKIYASVGFSFTGPGRLSCQINYTGTGTIANMLDVNGCTLANIGGFSLNGGTSATDFPTTALNIDAISTTASGTSEQCHFEDIYIQGTWQTGLAWGATGTSNGQDVYHHLFVKVDVIGSQVTPWGDPSRWQAGVVLGGAGHGSGNVIHPHFINCNVGGCGVGVLHNSVGVLWEGGCIQENQVDVFINSGSIGDPIVYRGFRSENSGMLEDSIAGPGNIQQTTFENVGWFTNNVVSGGVVVNHSLGGHFVLSDVVLYSTGATDNLGIAAGGSNGPQMTDMVNVSLTRNDNNPNPSAWFTPTGSASSSWTARNIGAIKTDGSGVLDATFVGPTGGTG